MACNFPIGKFNGLFIIDYCRKYSSSRGRILFEFFI
jgi:hypothetical protein